MKRIFILGIVCFATITAFGQVGNNNPTGPYGEFNGNVTTGCSYDPFTGNAQRTITDLTVYGAVGSYGLSYARVWNTRNGAWQGSFDWSINSVIGIPSSQAMHYNVHFPDGRVIVWTNPGPTTAAGVRERIIEAANLLYVVLTDGSKVEFTQNHTYYMGYDAYDNWVQLNDYTFSVNAITDPYGQRTNFTHNTDGTISKVTEPAGRYIQFFYTGTPARLDHITASDGRSVQYHYTTSTFSPGTTSYTCLTSVTYFGDSSLTSTYTYAKPNVGSANGSPVLSTCNEPLFGGPMKKISYVYATGNNLDGTAAVWGQIKSENSGTTGQAVSTLTVNGLTRTETCPVTIPGKPLGTKTRTFTYGPTNAYLLTSVTDFNGVADSRTYDGSGSVAALTDRNGNTTNFTNNQTTGLPTQIQFPATPGDVPAGTPRATLTRTYGWATCPDPNNRDTVNPYYLYSITDEGGHSTIYTRDASKRITRVDYPDGGYETFSYNGFGQVLSHVLRTTGTETFSYDARGLKQTFRDSYHATGNPNKRFQYDSLDRVSGITDALGATTGDPQHTTSYSYSNRGQVTVKTLPADPIDGVRHTIQYSYNTNGDGTLISVVDAVGATASFTYDDYRRPLTRTTALRFAGDTTPRTTSFFYDSSGSGNDYTHVDANLTNVTTPSGKKIRSTYDKNLRRTSITLGDGTSDAATTTYTYDNVGNQVSVVAPNQQPGQPNSGKKASLSFDQRNRVMSQTDALGKLTSITYDAAGRSASMTRPNGQVTTFDSYDACDRLLKKTVKQTPNPDAVTKATYYPSGLVHTFQDPKLVATNSSDSYAYVYDLRGRELSLTYPHDSHGIARAEAWHYDIAGRIDTHTNRSGNVQTFTYDGLMRLTGYSWNDGVTPPVTFSYDVASRLTGINNTLANVQRTYFNDGFLQSETSTYSDNVPRTVSYQYDADGNRSSVQYPNGTLGLNYSYSNREQLASVADAATQAAIANYAYDLNGNMTSRVPENGASSTFVYDSLDRMTKITNSFTNGARTLDYGYDVVSNRTWTKRDGANGDVFGYDAEDALTAAQLDVPNPDTTSPGSPAGLIISYDANGNRTSLANNSVADNYATNALNQYLTRTSSPISAQYDPNGNLTAAFDGSIYTFDAQNRLLSATKGTSAEYFTYDGLNRRISRTSGLSATVYEMYDGWSLIGEYAPGSTTPSSAFVYGARGLIKESTGTSSIYFYEDASGSTSHVADQSGQLLEWYRYDAHGNPFYFDATNHSQGSSSYGVQHLFGGKQYFTDLGLYDSRCRFYSPDIGRFIQPDPIGHAGDPTNLYRYCNNNPTTGSDPLGLWLWDTQPYQSNTDIQWADPVVVTADPIFDQDLDYLSITLPGTSNYSNFNMEFQAGMFYQQFAMSREIPGVVWNQNPAPPEETVPSDTNTLVSSQSSPPSLEPNPDQAPSTGPTATDVGNTGAGTVISSGIVEHIIAGDTYWLGKNFIYYARTWGGNGATGARRIAVGIGTLSRRVGYVGFAIQIGAAAVSVYHDSSPGNLAHQELNIGFGILGFAGLPGFIVGTGWTIFETSGGWEATEKQAMKYMHFSIGAPENIDDL